jgi:hypothetical protein
MKCKHPLKKIYSILCKDLINNKIVDVLWIGCLNCRKYLGQKILKPIIRKNRTVE